MAEETVQTEVKKEEGTTIGSDIEKQRDALLETGKTLETPKTPEEEEEILDAEEYEKKQWDTFNEKHPQLSKLGYKNIEDALDRLLGGLEQFHTDRDILAKLEEAGYDTRLKKEELLKQLPTLKQTIQKPSDQKVEPPKTFRDQRTQRLSKWIPKTIEDENIDPETNNPVKIRRNTTDEEKASYLKSHQEYAEDIIPAEKVEAIDKLSDASINLRDELAWMMFTLQPILEANKDKLLPSSLRDEITKHADEFPRTYQDIVEQEEKKGNFFNYYPVIYQHFLNSTKGDLIEAEKKKKWEEERQKEEKARKDAKIETAQRGTAIEKEKILAPTDLEERRARLLKLGKKLNEGG